MLQRITAILGLILLTALPAAAQQAPVADRYTMRDVMIPTRDGTRLHTRIYTPREHRSSSRPSSVVVQVVTRPST